MTLKTRFLSLILTFVPALLCAQSWIDITDDNVANPRFDNNNATGWTYNYTGNCNFNYQAMEVWNGTFKVYQTISVPNGKYRISVQAFYREGDNDVTYAKYKSNTENITGFLFVNSDKTKLTSIFSEYSTSYIDGTWMPNGENKYFPNNMYSVAQFFNGHRYWNTLETEVTDNTLTFGLVCEQQQYSSWCMFDNFKLEQYGTVKPLTDISLSPTALSLIMGETATLHATPIPSDATYRTFKWETSNDKVVAVDQKGNITALKEGSAIITVCAANNANIKKSCAVMVNRSNEGIDQLIINEIQSCNIDMYIDPSFNYGGWIELYNPTDKAVSLYGLYLSDDLFNLTKHRLSIANGVVPAKGFKTIWFYRSELHAAQVVFKLDYDGGTVFLSDYDGNVITMQDYPVGIPRTSYARTTDGGDTWGVTAEPTPGRSNASSVFATERLDAPVVDKDGCLFTSSFVVNVTIPTGATLRYTTDGTTPTMSNGITSATGRFTVSNTKTYRFRLFQTGKLPSQVITRSYIKKDREYKFPIISVVTDPVNLYDDSIGVYVRGVNGRPGNGQESPCNWNMDWDRPANFEYIDKDGKVEVNQEVDYLMCGGWTRASEPRSFKLKAEKIYEGHNFYEYQFFPNKNYLKHKMLQIRNGGNDSGSRIKDASLQEIMLTSGLYIEGQSYKPIHHFINGQYIGMLNMREPNNKFYAYANYGYDIEDLDQFEINPDSGYTQMTGTKDAFRLWYDLSAKASDADTYQRICELVDIDEYANYMAVELYLGNTDWPQNNVKGFKSRLEGGKFRFVIFDLDHAFNTSSPFTTFEGKKTHTFDVLYPSRTRITAEIEFVTIFLNMLANNQFRKKFIDSFCLVAGSVFTPERSNMIIDAIAADISSPLSWEGRNPYSTGNGLKSSLASRQQTLISALKSYQRMKLTAVTAQKVSLSANIDDANILVNDMIVPTNKFNGQLFAPITLKATAPAGYRFVGWRGANSQTSETKELFKSGSSWRFYDRGSLDGVNWRANNYTENNWQTGSAPLGYAKDGLKTQLSYGNSASNKYPTYYFRKSFMLDKAPSNDEEIIFDFTIDDGLIVYINGTEAGRYNMPDGTVSYSTYATSYANDNPDRGSMTLDPRLFVSGTNYIAVEVHNNAANSTDIMFDASLSLLSPSYTHISDDSEYTLPTKGSHNLVACFERISDEEQAESGITPVKINEISADNSVYINDIFKKNDWIELYNTTDREIDIEGMYISDNLKKPYKWQVPPSSTTGISTKIAPYSYFVLWADKLEGVSQLHTSFKLEMEGGDVLITAADMSWSDTLSYDKHYGEQSVGLYPDGSTTVYVMDRPTIGAANMINSYATIFHEPATPSGINDVELTGSEYLTLRFDGDNVWVCSPNNGKSLLRINTMAGQTYMSQSLTLTANTEECVNLSSLQNGVYLVSVTDAKGNKKTIKIMYRQ